MIFNLTIQNIFFILFFILAILVVGLSIDIIRLIKKEKRRASQPENYLSYPYPTNEFFLKISENFKKQLEESVNEEVKKNIQGLKNNFEKTSEEIVKNYKKEFEVGNKEVQKIISELSRQAAEETKKSSETLSEELSQKFAEIYQSTKITLNNKVAETEKEIESYKKEELKKIDREIYQMLGEVAKKTIGKAIDLSDHEKLVMEALEKAKKEIF